MLQISLAWSSYTGILSVQAGLTTTSSQWPSSSWWTCSVIATQLWVWASGLEVPPEFEEPPVDGLLFELLPPVDGLLFEI